MAMAGVSFTFGREGTNVYGESLNGIRANTPSHQFSVNVDPYLVPGLVATVALLVYGWFSSLLQQPITLLSWFFIVALLPGLLPSRQARKIN